MTDDIRRPGESCLTPTERSLRASIAANTRWSKPGAREAHSAKTRAAQLERYEKQVDPTGELDAAERALLAENALRADMQRLALKSSKARRQGRDAA